MAWPVAEKLTPPGSRQRAVTLQILCEPFGNFTMEVVAAETFGEIKTKLAGITGIPRHRQRLLLPRWSWYPRLRHDCCTLSWYNIEEYLCIELSSE